MSASLVRIMIATHDTLVHAVDVMDVNHVTLGMERGIWAPATKEYRMITGPQASRS